MFRLVSSVVIALLLVACTSTSQETVGQRRAEVQKMVQETVSSVQKHQSNIRQKMASAPGYAVFSNANVNVILASFSGGYGLAHDNASGKDIYMKMGEAGIGLGLGVKDFRAVYIFKTRKAFDRFVESGWMVGAHADAAAKADDKGGAAAAEIVADDVEIYQLTEAGLALQATIKGTKYWQDDSLN
ncbi:hypothetical protein KJY73_12225 [Bowmanella sp. Y26]|uniref:lipid-binding SYLF domain-containing protein n=1 Tax=Bowmanella yangjiangensis TaxID=2811230 RepID=UPI001BDC2095|nr:YSC84-related protein [Bowmanella yangjiangensis]MBT1064348.1 hypothetical protein [Bowmanella yangjiangensis]